MWNLYFCLVKFKFFLSLSLSLSLSLPFCNGKPPLIFLPVFCSYRNSSSLCIFHTRFLLQAIISLFPIERIKYRVISVRQLCEPLWTSIHCAPYCTVLQKFVLLHLYLALRSALLSTTFFCVDVFENRLTLSQYFAKS